MQAMILAAGLGKRMLPLTQSTPKPLLEVQGQPLIVHLIQALVNSGIIKVVINLHHMGEQIRALLGDGSNYQMQIVYSEEPKLLNTGGGIAKALPLLGDEPFIVVNADLYSGYPFAMLPKTITGLAHLVLVNNPYYHPQGDFALHDGQVSLIGSKFLTYGNISVLHPKLFVDLPSASFPLSLLLKRNISKGLVTGEHYMGEWYNIGTPELLEEVNNAV